jgi:hypothetical protein
MATRPHVLWREHNARHDRRADIDNERCQVSSLITWVADRLLKRHDERIEVHLQVHRADLHLLNGKRVPPTECFFLNVWNASAERRVQVTHIWIEIEGSQMHVLARPLPATIEPQHQWETWVEADSLPSGLDVERSCRRSLLTEQSSSLSLASPTIYRWLALFPASCCDGSHVTRMWTPTVEASRTE